MGPPTTQKFWSLARAQHGVVTRTQLRELGMGSGAIKHRVAHGRLHPLWRGVYAVGRPQLGRRGVWMAAVLSCGDGAVLSHASAAALWGIRSDREGRIEVSVPVPRDPHPAGIRVHRRSPLTAPDVTSHERIPVTAPACTLVDLATRLSREQLEAAVNAADKRDLIDPEELRVVLDRPGGRRRGAAILRTLLDRRTFTLTDSQLERRMLPLARRAGLSQPQTGCLVNGFKVDFYWPELDLVVETDGLRYHRTAAQQARDRLRDQAHAAAGTTSLRFTHDQVAHQPDHVTATLAAVGRRLRRA